MTATCERGGHFDDIWCDTGARLLGCRKQESDARAGPGFRPRSLGVRERTNNTNYGERGPTRSMGITCWSTARCSAAIHRGEAHDGTTAAVRSFAARYAPWWYESPATIALREKSDQNKNPSCSTTCISGVVFCRPWSSRWSAWPSTRIIVRLLMMFTNTACYETPVSICNERTALRRSSILLWLQTNN